MSKALAGLFLLVFCISIASASYITPYGEEKNVTAISIFARFIGEDKYIASAKLNRILVDTAINEQKEAEAISGNIVLPGVAAEPLEGKKLIIYLNGDKVGECITNNAGECELEIDLGLLDEEDKCGEMYAEFEGDEINGDSESAKQMLCKNEFISYGPAVSSVIESISENSAKTNVCTMFFIMIGFLIAGLYASGKDPLRLLDITSPRLPSARRKPEIKVSIGENPLREMRRNAKRFKQTTDECIMEVARKIAKEKAVKKKKRILEEIARKHKISVRKIAQMYRAELKRIMKKTEKEALEELMNEINRIRNEYERRIKAETSALSKPDAVRVEKELIDEMYEKITQTIRSRASEFPEVSSKIEGKLSDVIKNAEIYSSMHHLANLHSLAERGTAAGTGKVSGLRAGVEAVPIIGYGVRVVNNVFGHTGMPIRYFKEMRKTKKKKKKVENEIWKLERKEMLTDQEKRRLEDLKTIREKLNTFGTLPDKVKDYAEADMYLRELTKEIANAASHMLLKEIKKSTNEKLFDRWYGKLIANERDVFERCSKIIERARKKHINPELVQYADVILDSIRNAAESPLQNAENIFKIAREIYDNPEHFDEIITSQEDEIKRYIELGDFVDEKTLDVCRNEGLKSGIEHFRNANHMETYEDIKRTHARYLDSKRHAERINDIKREMLPFLVYDREFRGLISYLRDKGALPSQISAEQLDKLRVYYSRELSNIEEKYSKREYAAKSKEEAIAIRENKENELNEVRDRVLHALQEIAPSVDERMAIDYIESYEQNIDEVLTDVKKSLDADKAALMAAIDEWSKKRALDRAVGVTKMRIWKKILFRLLKGPLQNIRSMSKCSKI